MKSCHGIPCSTKWELNPFTLTFLAVYSIGSNSLSSSVSRKKDGRKFLLIFSLNYFRYVSCFSFSLKGKPNLVIVFDGERSLEKMETSKTRLMRAEKALTKLQSFVERLGDRSRSKAVRRQINRLALQAYQVKSEDISWLCNELQKNGIKM
jgi:hypothetical protein